jgi:hypothetical protein
MEEISFALFASYFSALFAVKLVFIAKHAKEIPQSMQSYFLRLTRGS